MNSPKRFILLFLAAITLFLSGKIWAQEELSLGKYVYIYSKAIDEQRRVIISLPEDYHQTFDTYPVLYVLDGTVKTLIEAKADVQMSKYFYAPNMIIVAVENTNRNRDMLPGTDAAPKFLKFLTEELIPYVQKNYRADTKHRVLYGGSNAGLFSMFTFLENPDFFSGYIISSPTICHRKKIMMDKLRDLIAKNVEVKKSMYIIYGDVDFMPVVDTLNVFLPRLMQLKQKGLQLKIDYLPNDGHIPYGSLQYGLMALYEGYSYPPEKLENEGLDSIKSYYERYSKKVGYLQKPPKEKIFFFAQELMRKNRIKEAVTAMEYCRTLYPRDYVASLLSAVAYYKEDDKDLAKKTFIETTEIMHEINISEEPPLEEWEAMKKEFR